MRTGRNLSRVRNIITVIIYLEMESQIEKLTRLIKYSTGEAKDLI